MNKTLFLSILIIIVVIGGLIFIPQLINIGNQHEEPIACTMDAKMCPDGSYVGRTGPHCEFAVCPGTVNDSWETSTDVVAGISFQYPKELGLTYVHPIDWPPQVRVLNDSFSCISAGSEIDRAGETTTQIIGDHTYCVTKITEGAAGSTYTQYTYVVMHLGKLVAMTFTLQMPQCANYDEPEMNTCKQEQQTFDADSLVDRMIRTIVISS